MIALMNKRFPISAELISAAGIPAEAELSKSGAQKLSLAHAERRFFYEGNGTFVDITVGRTRGTYEQVFGAIAQSEAFWSEKRANAAHDQSGHEYDNFFHHSD